VSCTLQRVDVFSIYRRRRTTDKARFQLGAVQQSDFSIVSFSSDLSQHNIKTQHVPFATADGQFSPSWFSHVKAVCFMSVYLARYIEYVSARVHDIFGPTLPFLQKSCVVVVGRDVSFIPLNPNIV